MMHIFGKRDPWNNKASLWVIAVVMFVLPMTVLSFKHIKMRNEIERWLPTKDPSARTLLWSREMFPQEDRVLVTWEDSDKRDPRPERMKHILVGQIQPDGSRRYGSRYISQVTTAQDAIQRIEKYKVSREEALSRMQGVMLGHGPLKVSLTELGELRAKNVKKELARQARDRFGIELEFKEAHVEFDPPKSFNKDAPSWIVELEKKNAPKQEFTAIAEHDFQVRWDGIRYQSEMTNGFIAFAKQLRTEPTEAVPEGRELVADCFFAVGSPVAMSITLTEAGEADVPATLQTIRDAAAQSGVDLDKFHMGGSPVAGSELNKALGVAAWNREAPMYLIHERSVIVTSWIVGAIIAFLVLRSLPLVGMVLGASLMSVILTMAIVPMTGGDLNMVLVVMPTLLMVLSMSGAIHVANYWKHAACEDPKSAVLRAVMMARKPCALASFTTAVGLLSLLSSELSPVRGFGFYSAIGCLFSLAAVLFAFPALLQFVPVKRPNRSDINADRWHLLGNLISKYNKPVMAVTAIVFVVSAFGLRFYTPETRVIKYFPETARVVQDYEFLEENLTGIVSFDVLIRFDKTAQKDMRFFERVEVVRDIKEKLREHPEISGALTLPDFQPVTEPLPKGAKLRQKMAFNKRNSEAKRRILTEPEAGAVAFVRVAEDSQDLFKDGDQRLSVAGDEVWRITAQVSIMSDLDYEVLSDHKHTGELDNIVKSVLKYHAGTSHTITGMVPVFLKTQNAVLRSLILSFVIAFGIIATMMARVLRDIPAALLTMVPNVVPIVMVFGLISWSGVTFDIGTVITASVALGIAVDGTLHLLTWFQKGMEDGLDKRQSTAQAMGHCGPAMWQTSCVVAIGMVMLYPASLSLVSRFGWLMAALITAALFADIILLPAMLAGPLGTVLQKSMERCRAKEQAARESAIALPEGVRVDGSHEELVPEKHERPVDKYSDLQMLDENSSNEMM